MSEHNSHKRLWLDMLVLGMIISLIIAYYVLATYGQSVIIDKQYYPTFGDDTYISMRYAKHLVEGHGLVWNPGERPIEGYTNFLWVLWISMLMLFVREPSYLMIASGAVFHILSISLLYLFLRKTLRCNIVTAIFSALILATWMPIRVQVLNALETPLLLFLFIAAIFFLFSDSPGKKQIYLGSFLSGLLPLVRPEGLFLSIILLAGFILQKFSVTEEFLTQIQRWKLILLCFFGPVIILTLFRLLYFHEWLPNTYYLKVTNRPGRIEYGIEYVYRFLKYFLGTSFIVPLILYGLFEKNYLIRILSFGIIGILAYVAYQGGDAWDWWRFMIPILPMFLIVLSFLTEQCKTYKSIYAFVFGIWITTISLGLWPVYTDLRNDSLFPKPQGATVDNIRLGLLFSKVCKPNTYIADFWAGAVPYFSGLPCIDMLGKSDWYIARQRVYKLGLPPGHDKFDFKYVLSQKPDIIISNHPLKITDKQILSVKTSDFTFGALLLENEQFQREYVPIESVISNRWRGVFYRRDSCACDWSRLLNEEHKLVNDTFSAMKAMPDSGFKADLRIKEIPLEMKKGEMISAVIMVKNISDQTWPSRGDSRGYYVVKLSYCFSKGAGEPVEEGERTPLPRDLKPGESLELTAVIKAPDMPGNYEIRFDMVQEAVAWFGHKNTDNYSRAARIAVKP